MQEIQSYSYPEDAACKGQDTERFYVDIDQNKNSKRLAKEVLAICGKCNVKEKCLDDALSQQEIHGIWGGTTPRERKAMLRVQKLKISSS